MSNCIFCQIIKKQIPANIVYENKNVLAFLDIKPINPGHTLVISKKHFKTLTDTPDDYLSEMIIVSKKIAKAIYKSLKIKGFNLGVNNNKIAGQLVSHVHFHIMPRRLKDGLKLWPQKKYKIGEAEKIAKKIKKNL